jgi:hypothetical protein
MLSPPDMQTAPGRGPDAQSEKPDDLYSNSAIRSSFQGSRQKLFRTHGSFWFVTHRWNRLHLRAVLP